MVTAAHVEAWLLACADALDREKDRLTDLDAAIGDADHGLNMQRGFGKVRATMPTGADLGALLKATGMALLSSVGGASGPLYGTFFLKAAAVAGSRTELTLEDLQAALQAGVDGLAARGKAAPGDKTMLDALLPAVQALPEGLEAAARAAEAGAKATIPLVARKGRASYLGERSAGHEDPGAASAALLMRALTQIIPAPAANGAE